MRQKTPSMKLNTAEPIAQFYSISLLGKGVQLGTCRAVTKSQWIEKFTCKYLTCDLTCQISIQKKDQKVMSKLDFASFQVSFCHGPLKAVDM